MERSTAHGPAGIERDLEDDGGDPRLLREIEAQELRQLPSRLAGKHDVTFAVQSQPEKRCRHDAILRVAQELPQAKACGYRI